MIFIKFIYDVLDCCDKYYKYLLVDENKNNVWNISMIECCLGLSYFIYVLFLMNIL